MPHAVNFLKQHLWAGNTQLKAFTAHVFDQDPHLEFATPSNLKRIATGCVTDLDRDIAFRFFHQSLADHP